MSKPLLIAKTGSTFGRIRDRFGDFEAWFLASFERTGVQCQVIAACDGVTLPAATDFSGIVVTGSPAMVSDREPWSEMLAEWLRHAADAGLPVLGVCYGHQLLAHAFGGVVDYHPQGREIGTHTVRLRSAAAHDLLFRQLPEQFKAHLTHAQSVLELPPGATLLASNDYEPHQAFRIGERVWGVQFHPEFSAPVMAAYIETFAPRLRQEGQDPQALLAAVEPTPIAQSILERFVRLL